MAIGGRLKEERSRLGYSQTDFGALAGIGKTTQINYEKGSGSPDANYLAAVAKVGLDVLYVVTGQRSHAPADGLSLTEQEVLEHFRKMAESDKQVLQRLAYSLAAATK